MVNRRRLSEFSPATAIMLAAYGLGGATERMYCVTDLQNLPDPLLASVVLVTGSSGSGKSQAIPHLLSRMGGEPITPDDLPHHDGPLISTWDIGPAEAAGRLTAVGLSDAYTWARVPAELSVGQRCRWDLARLIWSGRPLIVIDEWLAHLDRVTARAVAWATGRALRANGMQALLLTAHHDIAPDLCPDLQVHMRYGDTPELSYGVGDAPACSLVSQVAYRAGDRRDWQRLKALHYAAGDPATTHSIHVIEHPEISGIAGVAVMSYPDLHSAARNVATSDAYSIAGSSQAAKRLNREVLKLSRLVITPEVRGCGMARLLVNAAVSECGARWVECVTAMGRYNSFLASCGFREIPQGLADVEAALMDWAVRANVPPQITLDPAALKHWLDSQSVRCRREGRRLLWLHYHHFVLHRRTRSRPPKKVPGQSEPGWSEAYDIAARRMYERPSYWILGPIDPMTGHAEG